MSENHNQDEPIVDVSETISKADEIIEKNKKGISVAIMAVALAIGGYYGYNHFILAPKELKAESDIWMAENHFKSDSLNLALNGDGANYGFYDVQDEYSGTKTAELATYYAGISELRLGNYDNAVEQLNNFSTDEEMLQVLKLGALGDAYYGLKDNDRASSFYRKAVNLHPNELSTPFFMMKLGLLYEEMGLNEDALLTFETLKKEYASSSFGTDAKKYIGRIKQKMGK